MKAHTKHRLALKKKHCRHRPVILNRPVTYGYGHRSVNCMPAESEQQTMLRTVIEVKYHFLTNFVSQSQILLFLEDNATSQVCREFKKIFDTSPCPIQLQSPLLLSLFLCSGIKLLLCHPRAMLSFPCSVTPPPPSDHPPTLSPSPALSSPCYVIISSHVIISLLCHL